MHGPCVVRLVGWSADTASACLFSRVLERDGRFKFLSYANKLD